MKLLEELQLADDRSFLSLALADTEEHDDLDDRQNAHADDAGNRYDEGPAQKRGDDAKQNVGNGDLQSFANMEHSESRLLSSEQRNDDAYGAKQVGQHGEDFVVRNVLSIEVSGMIKRINDRSRLILLIRLLLILLLELIVLLLRLRIRVRSGCKNSTALRARGSSIIERSTTLRTKCHGIIPSFLLPHKAAYIFFMEL